MAETSQPPPGPEVLERRVLDVIDRLMAELQAGAAWTPRPTVSSLLERDLGLDSLGRLELVTRLEADCGGSLDRERAVVAESVAELLAALGSRPVAPSGRLGRGGGSEAGRPGAIDPERRDQLRSLPEVLTRLVERDPERVSVRLLAGEGQVEPIRAGELLRGAREVAAGLARCIEAGEPVGLMRGTDRQFIEAFFGIQMAGGVPVPLAPAPRPSQLEDHLSRQLAILDDCAAGVLVAAPEVEALARWLRLRAPSVRQVVAVEELRRDRGGLVPWRSHDDDPALLQYTSGSTGAPKGVVLTHGNLLANLEAIARALETGPDDVFVSWLPLYHDMGLIGGLLHPLYCGIPLVLMPPLTFLARPELWLRAISEERGTMTVAPNFAYEICQRRAAGLDLQALDLSRWRLALNGAEPVSPATVDRFSRRFAPHGFRREAMLPVYGLAENTLAVTFPGLGSAPRLDRVRRDALLSRGVAEPAAEGEDALELVGCGRPIQGVELRLVDAGGREVGERRIGRVQFRGSSATRGYYRNAAETERLFDGDWIRSGDLGYRADGELFLTGRSKDIIIHAGRNLSPHALEEGAGDVEGVRKGCVAAFGVPDPRLGTEKLVVVAETRESDGERRRHLVAAINEVAARVVGVAPDDVCLVPPHTLLKTSSGKIRRSACRDLYVAGDLARGSRRAVWRQLAGTLAAAATSWLRGVARRLPTALYSAYLWLAAVLLLGVLWIGVAALPRRAWRKGLARGGCRLFFWLTGIRLTVRGAERLEGTGIPEGGGSVLAVNHASYLDSMLLMAALPRDLTFVAKRSFAANPVTGLLMRRLGVAFVDPSGVGDPRAELETMAARVAAGELLAVFVEGTFVRARGLRPFRLGAFDVAARAGCGVVPVVLRGSRELLRDEQWWFRRGPLEVRVLAPVASHGAGFEAALRLRDTVRAAMLEHVDEPDLEARGPDVAAGESSAASAAATSRVMAEGAR